MRILNWYVVRMFFATFLTAMGILTFAMTGARLVKVFDYISSGVPLSSALNVIMLIVPIVMSLSIPWAALVSVMLVFGRLSADNEITAMRTSGISILQIVAPILLIAFLLTGLCLYLQLELGPACFGKARYQMRNVLIEQPMTLFEPGRPVRFNDLNFYIGAKNKDTIYDIQVWRMNNQGSWEQDVTARSGKIRIDRVKQSLDIVLENVIVNMMEGRQRRASFSKELIFSIDYGKEFNNVGLSRRADFVGLFDLLARMSIEKKNGKDTTELEVELNSRIALSLAPLAFLLLGMPLAIRTSRRETSVGLFLSVLLAGIYFGGVMISGSLAELPKIYPQFLVWIPPLFFQIFGAFYIFKIAKR